MGDYIYTVLAYRVEDAEVVSYPEILGSFSSMDKAAKAIVEDMGKCTVFRDIRGVPCSYEEKDYDIVKVKLDDAGVVDTTNFSEISGWYDRNAKEE